MTINIRCFRIFGNIPIFGSGTTHELMAYTVICLIIPLLCSILTTWGSVFYEKDGWRAALRFVVLLVAAAGLALSVDKAMPMIREMCSREMMDESVLKYSLALVYIGALALMTVASFYMVVLDGLFGCPGGWLRAAGCVITGLMLAAPTLSLGIFVIKNFWWLALAVLAVIAVIGTIVGGVSGRVGASSQGGTFVDKFGNEYVSTSDQNRIYHSGETWNTTKEYHIKGQSGTFYRKIK